MAHEKNIILPDSISASVTWVNGQCIFKPETVYSKFYYGICSYSELIFGVTPKDYKNMLMVVTINVAPKSGVCDRAKSCLNFLCPLNRFTKESFLEEFDGMGAFTLGLPNKLGVEQVWFNSGRWAEFWKRMIIPITGGTLEYRDTSG